MPLVSRSSIEEIKNRVNILDVVEPVVALKKSGRNFVGLSPFTSEKTPSFFVLPEKNIFKCFSSGHAGDIFRFLQLQEKVTFAEAIEIVAERFNLTLEYEQGARPHRESRSLRRELLEIHEQACDYYHRCFLEDSPAAKSTRGYWCRERDFPHELAVEFKIGLAPPDQSPLLERLTRNGIGIEALKKCGLFYANDRETNVRRLRPRFRGRLTIPIRDYQGQVIAFSARKLDLTPEDDPTHQAKYINSPETPVFNKSSIVFGLDRARQHIDAVGYFVLVEGQLDVLRCWQHGVHTAVAPQGTSVTEGQMRLLKRYANRIDSVLDGDEAGQKAALRLLPLAFEAGHEVRILPLPDAMDPDTLLAQGGREALLKLQHNPLSAMHFAVRSLLPSGPPSAREKAEVLRQIFEIIIRCDLEIVQRDYLDEAVAILGVDCEAAIRDFKRFRHWRGRRSTASTPAPVAVEDDEICKGRLTTSEYELLWLVFHYEWLTEPVLRSIDLDWLDSSTVHGRLLARIFADVQEGLWKGVEKVDPLLENDEERDSVYSILAVELDFEDPAKVAGDCLKALFDRSVNARMSQLQIQIDKLPASSDQSPHFQRKLVELREIKRHPPILQVPSRN